MELYNNNFLGMVYFTGFNGGDGEEEILSITITKNPAGDFYYEIKTKSGKIFTVDSINFNMSTTINYIENSCILFTDGTRVLKCIVPINLIDRIINNLGINW